jgi:adenosylcobinamide-phosphate synthase
VSVLVAAALDGVAGEPPAAAHPVVWTGRYLARASRIVPSGPPVRATLAGGAAWLVGAVIAVAAGCLVERASRRAGVPGRAVVRGLTLWPLLSGRMLLAEVEAVERAVQQDLMEGRAALARIVSRDTSGLTEVEVRSGAIESLSENLSDSLVAPLFWFLVAGLPGAALYRFANTADACWGYRTARWQYAGRVAALVDDALNVVPARLTGLLLYRGTDWARLRREAGRTPSPNAGWPMAAIALRLGLRLTKRGDYDLNPAGAEPGHGDVTEAVRAGRRTAVVALAGAAAGERLIRRYRGAPR